jgi:hypothetical protein
MATATITRVEELQTFKHDLSKKNVKIDAEFQEGLRIAQRLLELSEQDIADELGVSRPSVNRWINGKNLPHNAMRRVVFSWIEKQLSGRVRKVASIQRSQATYASPAAAVSVPMYAKGRE